MRSLSFTQALGAAMVSVLSLFGLPTQALATSFNSTLSGAAEAPPVTTMGTGTVTADLDPETKVLRWKISYSGLSGPVTAAHIHGPALPGQSAAVLMRFKSPFDSPFEGQATLTEAQVKELMAGKWYVNLHTAANPGGEIRAQLTPTP